MTDTPALPTPTHSWALLPLVFLSGASGLVFEVVWVRALGLHFGTTTAGITTVLAAFMAGLALGNMLFGGRADRHERPIALYRALELGIGLTGLVVSMFLLQGGALLELLAHAIAAAGPAAAPLRFAVFFTLVLIPTTLMGGTLPALSRALVRTGTQGRIVGALYALNTAGAVAGALLPDFLLVPAIGLWATSGVAALGNLTVATLVGRVRVAPAPPPPPASAPRVREPLPRLPWLLYTVSGFCAMGYEILWSRLIRHWSIDRVTAFSILLAVFLAFLALGSQLGSGRADRSRRPLFVASVMLAMTAVLSFLPLMLSHTVPPVITAVVADLSVGTARAAPWVEWLGAFLNAIYLAALPCVLMGAAFPFIAAAVVRESNAGSATGQLYAANTLAGVVGSILTGFVLMPWLGVQNAMLVMCLVAAGVGSTIAWITSGGAVGRRAIAVAIGGGLLVSGVALPPDHLRVTFFDTGDGVVDVMTEGSTTTAAGVRSMWFGEPSYRELRTPGTAMSSTRFSSQRYMGLMGHLPLLFSQEGTDALLICYGVGNTARSLLAHASLAHLDVVDISDEVISMSDYFAPVHGSDPLADPRVTVHVDDGRQHLITTDRRYDAITSEPPPPSAAGVVNLYSVEYYEKARRTLKEGGVLAQWLPVFQLTLEESLAVVAAFVAEFPHTAMFHGYGYQWILLGSQQPLRIDVDRWLARVEQPEVAHDLRRIGVDGIADLLASYMQHDAGLRAAAGSTPPLTDDLPSIQYPARALERLELPDGMLGDLTDVFQMMGGGKRVRDDPQFMARLQAALKSMNIVHQALPALWLGEAEVREMMFGAAMMGALHHQPDHLHLLATLRLGPDRAGPAAAAVESGRPTPGALLTLGRKAFYARDWEGTLQWLDKLQPDTARTPVYWLIRGGAERALGRLEAARTSLGRAAAGSRSDFFKDQIDKTLARLGEPIEPWMSPVQPVD